MQDRTGHAVVLGASWAGLVHAVPLAERFGRVTLVDRDRLPDDAAQRRGVPQGGHLHLLVPGGVQRLEQLLPGVVDDLAERGAHLVPAPEWRFHMGGGRLVLDDDELRVVGATRPLLEAVVREQVRSLPGVELREGWSARGLVTEQDGGPVTGVRLRAADDPDRQEVLSCDLVVDVTGRGSATPRWLEELGHQPPQEERLHVDVRYATRLFRRDPSDLDGCRHVLVDVPPGVRRGGVALAVEDERWLVTLIGMLGERPPTDLVGFREYAASLWVDDLHRVVDGAPPVGEPTEQAFPAFSWKRYDRLDRLPRRLAVSGDAVCSFNPRFGQGMTVALEEALLLGSVLDEHGPEHVGEHLAAAAGATVRDAWDLATGADLGDPGVDGPRPLSWQATNAYLRRLFPVAHRDPATAAALVRVVGMLDRPQDLLHPRVLLGVLRGAREPAPVAG